jgi:hypothetical protein
MLARRSCRHVRVRAGARDLRLRRALGTALGLVNVFMIVVVVGVARNVDTVEGHAAHDRCNDRGDWPVAQHVWNDCDVAGVS